MDISHDDPFDDISRPPSDETDSWLPELRTLVETARISYCSAVAVAARKVDLDRAAAEYAALRAKGSGRWKIVGLLIRGRGQGGCRRLRLKVTPIHEPQLSRGHVLRPVLR